MSALEKVRSAELPPAMRKRFGLDADQEIYLKVIRLEEVTLIQQKMRHHLGLSHEEMEIAADLGWIERDQLMF